MKLALRRTATLALLVCFAAAVFTLPALAASIHSITGTARNDTQWYTSTTPRKVAYSGTTIRAAFNNLCVRPLYFRIINGNTGAQIGSTITASGNSQNIATNVRANTVFYNSFRLSASCYSWQDRDFAGSEWY